MHEQTAFRFMNAWIIRRILFIPSIRDIIITDRCPVNIDILVVATQIRPKTQNGDFLKYGSTLFLLNAIYL
jgi:hypothetical protein